MPGRLTTSKNVCDIVMLAIALVMLMPMLLVYLVVCSDVLFISTAQLAHVWYSLDTGCLCCVGTMWRLLQANAVFLDTLLLLSVPDYMPFIEFVVFLVMWIGKRIAVGFGNAMHVACRILTLLVLYPTPVMQQVFMDRALQALMRVTLYNNEWLSILGVADCVHFIEFVVLLIMWTVYSGIRIAAGFGNAMRVACRILTCLVLHATSAIQQVFTNRAFQALLCVTLYNNEWRVMLLVLASFSMAAHIYRSQPGVMVRPKAVWQTCSRRRRHYRSTNHSLSRRPKHRGRKHHGKAIPQQVGLPVQMW